MSVSCSKQILDINTYLYHTKYLKFNFNTSSEYNCDIDVCDTIKQESYIRTFEEWALRLIYSIQIKSTNLVYWAKCLKHYLLGKSANATDLLALVHSEASGPMSSQARCGYEYFETYTDVASRYGYVFLLKKTDRKLLQFGHEINKQIG